MITQESIKNYLQQQLQSIADDLSYNIEFNGEVSFYDHKWVKERANIKITPFCVTQNSLETISDGLETTTSRYTFIILGFSKDREQLKNIVNELMKDMSNGSNVVLDDYTVSFKPLGDEALEDFTEGSGIAQKRFEYAVSFEATSMKGLINSNDIVIKYNNIIIPFNSFKWTHGKTNFVNVANSTNGTTDTNNNNIFRNEVVVEAYYTKSSSDVVHDLISKKTASDISRNLKITVNSNDIVNDNYVFDGFQLSNNKVEILTVFLYFTREENKGTIKIDGVSIPIMDFTVSMQTVPEPMQPINSNIVKNIILGRARVYGFIISESDNSAYTSFMTKLTDALLSDEDENLLFEVEITYLSSVYTKTLSLMEISKDSKTGMKNIQTLKFTDGSDL